MAKWNKTKEVLKSQGKICQLIGQFLAGHRFYVVIFLLVYLRLNSQGKRNRKIVGQFRSADLASLTVTISAHWRLLLLRFPNTQASTKANMPNKVKF